MGISKVILNGVVKVDLTQDTVDETNLLAGETATGADGEAVEGSIASKASADLTVSGATVTAPAGFYSAAASKSVATTTHPNPTASINSTTGVVTASHTQGTGYVTGGTTTGTLNLTTQAAKTVTPTESEQTAVAAGRYTTGAVKVGAISSTYIGSDIAQNDSDDLTVSGATVNVPAGYYAEAASKSVGTTTHPAPTASINSSTGLVTASHTQGTGYVTGGTTTGTLQITAQAAKTVAPTESEQTAVEAGRYTTGAVKVGAISSTYVGSDITQRDSDDLTASGATVSVPAGYYSASASKAVASGSAGTPTATKGTVSNHSVSVTPSVTNTTGYITGGTRTGTAVTVNVAELESGTKSITENGTGISVSGYSTVDVAVPGQIPTGVKYVYSDIDGEGAWDVSGYQYCSFDYAPVKDGFMRIWFDVDSGETVTINTNKNDNNSYINWGDGNTQTGINTDNTHTYTNAGVYVAELYLDTTTQVLSQYAFGQSSSAGNTSVLAIETPYNAYSTSFSATGYCSNLKRATVNTPIKTISSSAFRGCESLTSLSLPVGLTSITSSAFRDCTSLALISLPDEVTKIGDNAFYGCTSLALTSLPDGVTLIDNAAFRNCTSLALTSLPEGLTSIGANAFRDCTSLALTLLPDGLTSIGGATFYGCTSITNLVLPSSVTDIGVNAFYKVATTTNKLTLTILATTPPTLGSSAFATFTLNKIYVPAASLEAYKTATNWSAYASYMEAIA